MPTAPPLRTALLAGATGLIGRELLALLGADPAYGKIHVWQRRQSSAGALPASAKVTFHTVDFAHPPPAPKPLDEVYIALGTTIKVAGSQAAFRAVDHDHLIAAASAARAAGATRLAVVSALGADAKSGIFYNRVKGEMQQAIAQLGFESVVIAQPSLLIGDRAALGQPVRSGEVWAVRLLGPLIGLVPASVRPIEASAVATAMLAAMAQAHPGVRLLPSSEMQPR